MAVIWVRPLAPAMIAVVVPSVIVGVAFAPQILQVFGTSYSHHGTTLLRMLLLSLPGSSVTIFYSAFVWLDKRVWWMTARNTASSAIQLAVILLLIRRHGIDAIGYAALVNSSITLILFLPITIKRYRMTEVSRTLGE